MLFSRDPWITFWISSTEINAKVMLSYEIQHNSIPPAASSPPSTISSHTTSSMANSAKEPTTTNRCSFSPNPSSVANYPPTRTVQHSPWILRRDRQQPLLCSGGGFIAGQSSLDWFWWWDRLWISQLIRRKNNCRLVWGSLCPDHLDSGILGICILGINSSCSDRAISACDNL